MSEAEEVCTWCGHRIHKGRCLGTRLLLQGMEACHCKSVNNQGPKPRRERKPPQVNTGQHCDARLLMPVTVLHPCQVVNTKQEKGNVRHYEIVMDGAVVPAWLCRPHMLAAKALAGVSVWATAALDEKARKRGWTP